MANQNMGRVLMMLSAAYSNFTMNEFTPRVFEQILGDLPGDLLEAATMQCLSEPRAFAPAPGEIRAAATRLRAQAQGIPSGPIAYQEVANMPADMRKCLGEQDGTITYARLKWSHPFVGHIAHVIGWPGNFPSDSPTSDRAQFLKIYDAELTKELQAASQLPVVEKYLTANNTAALAMQNMARQLGSPK